MTRTRTFALALLVLCTGPWALAQDGPHQDLWDLNNSGQGEEALELALERLPGHPGDRDLNHLIGRVLCNLGRPLEGKPYLEVVVDAEERDWRYAWSRFYLGYVALTQGDDETAVNAWTEVRDGKITANVARNAANNLRAFALDEEFADWTRLRTEHCIFAFSPRHAGQDLEAFAAEHEDAFAELTDFFGGKPPWPVRYIVWSSSEEARDLCGIQNLGFAKPRLCTIHCRWDQTVGHELTHVVSFQALQPIERTGLINEGLAVLFDLTGRDRLARARAAVQEAGLTTLDLAGWWRDPAQAGEATLYPVAGAWLHTLLERGGKEKLLELCREQTLPKAREIYGVDLDEWMEEFELAVLEGS